MYRKTASLILGSVLLTLTGTASADAPNFMPALYGDGEIWGTKGTTTLPPPNDHNEQSFDALYIIINNPDAVQLPVSEAAPGNPHYNGGRWFTHTVMWTDQGLANNNPVPVLTSYDEIVQYEQVGDLMVTAGTFDGGPPPYFQCPLLPVKQ